MTYKIEAFYDEKQDEAKGKSFEQFLDDDIFKYGKKQEVAINELLLMQLIREVKKINKK